ncbi:anhydro-N-acetylmuramic acid kinase [Saccharopolyspora gloriosae]|uniref:anhydro-N-acetylmuramic acid kinase n=1 Tax=Saccharopolyspora gloriosae TaxID=455344 RepID=UPI001FB66C44|nr:anhydro-N-acetylmuramic acid kinase [Saccharopolyspora gloriosae]
MSSWRVLGLISGTSMDGIDVAVGELSLPGGGVAELRPGGFTEVAYPAELRRRLLAALPPAGVDAREFCVLDTEVGLAFAAAARAGIAEFGEVDLIASLGQTLYHWVEDGRARGTTQLGQAAWIAEATGVPVIADLRARDVAAGGHGAPLAGVLDALWLADRPRPAIALNIGGIANITVVGGPEPLAYDTGPGNALLDAAAAQVTGGTAASDLGGLIAAGGQVHEELLARLLADDYYREAPPKSTGKEHFNADYLARAVRGLDVSGPDLLATLTELTAATIADACHRHGPREVIASGGGVHNPTLMAALRERLRGDRPGTADVEVHVSDDLGLPAAGKEGYLTALLGWLTWNGLPGNVPGTTGADGPRLLGAITPGTAPLRLPEPAREPVRRLRITHPTTPMEAE